MQKNHDKKPRGRPAKSGRHSADTRANIIRSGIEHFTEFGFSGSGLDKILKKASIPKGSFYHYFQNKEVFGLTVIEHYDDYFCHKLTSHLTNDDLPVNERLMSFVNNAKAGIEKYHFNRGCLVGNLEQEVALLPDSHREKLHQVMQGWKIKISTYIKLLNPEWEDLECESLAEFFWLGWEGAVSRCKLVQTTQPIDLFIKHFLKMLAKK